MTVPAAFESGSEEARRDIAAGLLRLKYGVSSSWGVDLQETLKVRFNVELIWLSCFVTNESSSSVAGYNAVAEAHIDGLFGEGSVAAVRQEVQHRRKEKYEAWVAAN